jgi:hypothetical protein
MVNKGILEDIKITKLLAPISVNATADWTRIDTVNYESCLVVVDLGVVAADIDWVLTLKDNNTSTATAGDAVDGSAGLARWVVSDKSATVLAKFDTDGVLTLSAAADGGRLVMWEYYGPKRFVGVSVTSAGGKAGIVGVTAIQSHPRYQGREGLHDN